MNHILETERPVAKHQKRVDEREVVYYYGLGFSHVLIWKLFTQCVSHSTDMFF